MLTISIDEANRDLAGTIARVTDGRQPLAIRENGRADVALVPVEVLERLREIAADRDTRIWFDRAGRMARMGYWEWDDIADRCVACTSQVAELFGVSPEEFLRRANSTESFLLWVHPDDRARVDEVMDESVRRQGPYEVEYRLVRDDGNILDVREVAEPILDSEGRRVGSAGIVQDISERKQAERELREREALLSSINRQLPGSVYRRIVAADGGDSYSFVSSGTRELLGFGPEEIMENPRLYSDNIPLEDRKTRERATRHAVETLERYDEEFRYIMPNGKTVWIRAIADPERMDNGDVVFTGITLDVTERKQLEEELRRSRDLLEQRVRERTRDLAAANKALEAEILDRRETEAALRQSEEQLRQVIDNLPILIGLVDNEERLIWCNRLTAEWQQRPLEEVIGRRIVEVNGPAHYAKIRPAIEAVMAGRRFENETEITYPDGVARHVHRIYVPNIASDGTISGFYFFIHDVTGRKAAEQAIREYSDQLKLITDNLPVLIAYVGADERYKFVNSCCCEWYARPSEEIIGRSIGDIFQEKYDLFADRLAQVRAGNAVEFEDRISYPDGATRDIRAQFVPHKADDGTVIGMFSLVEDVTAVKQAEERARQSQKMEAVGQLTGGVAHDFNNLLAVIIGNAEILVEDLGDDDPSTSAILRAARRGTELTRRLLAFSRRQPLDPRPVDLGKLAQGMTGMLARTLGESIEVEVIRDEGLWCAMADAGQVENALLNLAINARDAMPGGGRLTIECQNARLDKYSLPENVDASPGTYAVLSVSDSGTGMSPSVLEHAFEPFFTTKEVGQGTGLGLSMIYGFAKQSGGHVTIDSDVGKGTTVKLYLPRAGDEISPCTPEDLSALPKGNGETILVLEDDDDVRALAVRILRALNYRVIEASCADEAGRMLEMENGVDLLLSDVMLPGGLNGPELAQHARRLDPGLKVLFMSGYPAEATRSNGSAGLGGAMLLKKPLDRRELAQALYTLLRG